MKTTYWMTGLTLAGLIGGCTLQPASQPATPKKLTAATAPKATAQLTVKSDMTASKAAPLSAASVQAAGVTVDTAQIVIASINLKGWEADEGDSDDDSTQADSHDAQRDNSSTKILGEDSGSDTGEAEVPEVEGVDFKGPFVVDLLTGGSAPSLNTVTLPSGSYGRIEFKLDAIESDAEEGGSDARTHGMKGASFQVSGQMPLDGTTRRFVFQDRKDQEIKWSFPAPVSVNASKINDLVLSIPLNRWFNAALVQALVDAYHAGDVTSSTSGTLYFSTEDGKLADVMEANEKGTSGEMNHDAAGESGD